MLVGLAHGGCPGQPPEDDEATTSYRASGARLDASGGSSAETSVRRETVSRYARPADPNAAKVFPGSGGRREREVGVLAGRGPNAAEVTAGPWANAAKVFPGSELPPRSAAGMYRATIAEKLNGRV